MLPPGGGKFSVAQQLIPVSARPVLNRSTGLIIRYSSPPGAAGVSLWRIRVSSAMDTTFRFVHLFSIPANGVVNETRYMPWRDFFGQIIERKSTKIQKCGKDIIGDPRCTIKPEMLTHVSFLESEDTIAHAIELHQVILTTDPISEQNQLQHHTEEAEALLWEREHHALNTQDFYYNGTRYVIGGNCTGVCTMTTTTSMLPDDSPTGAVPEMGVAAAEASSLFVQGLWLMVAVAVLQILA